MKKQLILFVLFSISITTIFAQQTGTFSTSNRIGLRLTNPNGIVSYWGENGGEKWIFGLSGAANDDSFIIYDRVNSQPAIVIDGATDDFEFRASANILGKLKVGNPVTLPADYVAGFHGKILSEEIKVNLHENWPDYVFEDSYELMDLNVVEGFIMENGHLPEIPSAKDVEANQGIELGEMNRKLLQKIEELTLYVIEQNKRIKALEEGVKK